MVSMEEIIRKDKKLYKSILIRFLRERKLSILRELEEVRRKIRSFELKHGDFEEFSKSLPDDFESHEIWFEWKSLIELEKELERKLADVEKAIREVIGEV